MNYRKTRHINFLRKFEIEEEEASIYLYLLENGAKTALELSNEIKLSRTVIYRIVENLVLKGLLTENLEENGRRFEANPPDTLKIKMIEKELRIKSLEESLPEILEMLSLVSNNNISKSSIKYYRGVEGLKQVTWNETKAVKEFRIYEIGKMADFVENDFNRQVLQEFVNNKITDYQLTNRAPFNDFTDVEEFVQKYWKVRYISKEDIAINFETIIYNNVYGMYEYKGSEIFCIEIYNDKLAETQKNIFDFVWSYARPLKLINNRGKAVLE